MRICPKCGGSDFRVRMYAVFAFDGEEVTDTTVRNDLNEDIINDPDFDESVVICQNGNCDWQGLVCGLKEVCACGRVHEPITFEEGQDEECPNCKNGTLEVNEAGEVVCRGECGAVIRKKDTADDRDPNSPVEFTESPAGERARERWAEAYDELNGAPENDGDR
jgi:hypothetical protein